jgi:hypothetical protein
MTRNQIQVWCARCNATQISPPGHVYGLSDQVGLPDGWGTRFLKERQLILCPECFAEVRMALNRAEQEFLSTV